MKSVTGGVCLAVFGVALLWSTDAFAMEQPDTQSPVILAQAGGGSGGQADVRGDIGIRWHQAGAQAAFEGVAFCSGSSFDRCDNPRPW